MISSVLLQVNECIGDLSLIDSVELMPATGPAAFIQIDPRLATIHLSLAYSALACFRIGISGSASFHCRRNCLYWLRALV